jgi:hypothetical protein
MEAFHFYLQLGKQKRHGAKSGEKGMTVMMFPVLLSPKFRSKSLHIFTQLLKNVTVVCGIDCSACQGSHAPHFALHLS